MANQEAVNPREALGARIRQLDERIGTLRTRLAATREEVSRLIEKENRQVRLFAEADRHEKKAIDEALVEIVAQRSSLERETQGLAITVHELEAERQKIYPAYEQLCLAHQREERRRKIEEARRVHEADQRAEQEADRALLAARDKSNKSYFTLRALLDQEAVNEALAATEKLKEEWSRHAGPNAPNQRRVN